MPTDPSELLLKELSQRMRGADAEDAPSFDRLWQRAIAASRDSRGLRSSSLVLLAVAGVVLLVTAVAVWRGSENRAEQTALAEAELITVDGALLTYWEAPTDVFLDPAWSAAPRQVH